MAQLHRLLLLGVLGASFTAPRAGACLSEGFQLRSGATMPRIAFGTGTQWFRKTDGGAQLRQSCAHALEAGARHLDCAEMYGTESAVGDAISEHRRRHGLERRELFLTGKSWESMKEGAVRKGLERTLADLRTDYLDLYLLHAPFVAEDKSGWAEAPRGSPVAELLAGAWREMERLKEEGLVRHIGVSNFRSGDLERLREVASEMPEVNQVEGNPMLRQPALEAYCAQHGIAIVNYSPLMPLSMAREDPSAFGDLAAAVSAVAERRGMDPSAVLLSWSLRIGRGVVTTSSDPERARANLGCLEAAPRLSDEDVAAISSAGAKAPHRQYWQSSYGTDWEG